MHKKEKPTYNKLGENSGVASFHSDTCCFFLMEKNSNQVVPICSLIIQTQLYRFILPTSAKPGGLSGIRVRYPKGALQASSHGWGMVLSISTQIWGHPPLKTTPCLSPPPQTSSEKALHLAPQLCFAAKPMTCREEGPFTATGKQKDLSHRVLRLGVGGGNGNGRKLRKLRGETERAQGRQEGS